MSISFITIALHLIDRQNDYMTRLDYNLNQHLKKDKAEANVQHKINCALIYNILPMHVGESIAENVTTTELICIDFQLIYT